MSLALLGCGGVASAKLVADPASTDPLATGPSAVPPVSTVLTTTATAATTTRPVTTTKPATTTTVVTTTTARTATAPARPTVAESAAASTLVVNGHGWGHGIGMAQWGANGYAQHGWDYRQILAHYYQGTTIAAQPAPAVRVLLAEGRTRVALVSDSPWKVVDAHGTAVSLLAGTLAVAPDLVVSGQ